MTTPANATGADAAIQFRAATETAALYDSSHVGRLKATGADALDLLNRMSTNAVIDLQPGQGAPTILTTDRGRILDILAVVNLGDYVLLLTSPGRQQAVIEWLDKYTIMEDLEITDVTAETAMLTVMGPGAARAVADAAGLPVADLPPYHFARVEAAGHSAVVINRPQGTLPGFDVMTSPAGMGAVAECLTAAGVVPIDAAVYDSARIAAAVPEYGREMGDAYNPLEAGLIGGIDFDKGCYIGQEVIARLDTYQKVQKRLVTLRLPVGGPADVNEVAGMSLRCDGRDVGTVTSAAVNPATGEVAGLGYVRSAHAVVGTRLELGETDGDGQVWAEIVDLPQFFGSGQY